MPTQSWYQVRWIFHPNGYSFECIYGKKKKKEWLHLTLLGNITSGKPTKKTKLKYLDCWRPAQLTTLSKSGTRSIMPSKSKKLWQVIRDGHGMQPFQLTRLIWWRGLQIIQRGYGTCRREKQFGIITVTRRLWFVWHYMTSVCRWDFCGGRWCVCMLE
jgi:hypothetical protein